MSDQTWAVEHRPRRFSDVVGQPQVTPLLAAMVAKAHAGTKRFPPGLVFYGSRGTGKTTTARILSAALNCPNTIKGEPCCECQSCHEIETESTPGVVEVDMASHGSVDDIRNLKTSSMLSFAARWRVYLLDEVHSASRAAFDALLKLLEEPPPHTLFILVTTEPDRIPETIRSRCLPYEFRRISIGVIVPRLRFIAAQHGEAERIDERVYELLAQRAKGGMRDAVMSLEQLSYKDGQITEATVRDIFAVTDLPQRLLDAAVKGDMQRGLTVLNEAVESSLPPVSLADDMLTGLNALLCMAYGVQPEMSPVTPEWLAAYSRIDPKLVLDGLASLWDARKLMRPGDPSGFATLRIGYASLVGALTPAVLPASAGLPGIAHTSVPTLPVPEHRLMGTPLASLQPSGFLTTDEALAALEDL